MKKCVICEKELDGNKRIYCSNNCKSKGHYNKNKQNNTYHSQTIRGLKRKLKLIDIKGSKCNKCGYDKNIAALEFNHLCCKSFSLDMRVLSNNKWEIILEEANKCELLCANCHREHHNPELNSDNIQNILDKSLIKVIESKSNTIECLNCKTKFKKVNGKIYCSKECNTSYKKYPSKEEILNKYEVLKSWVKVSEHFKLSKKIITRLRNITPS
jgi:hypothetical protein